MSSHKDFVVATPPPSASASASKSAKTKKARQPRPAGAETALQKRRRNTALSILSSYVPLVSASTANASTSKALPEQKRPRISHDHDDDDVIDLTASEQPAPVEPTAKTPKSRDTVNKWLGLIELARQTGLHSVTTVDPGTRNCALCRVEFYPVIRLTHFRVLDLHVLCSAMEQNDDTTVLKSSEGYTIDALAYALGAYIKREAASANGCFNSSIVLVEEQSFSRDMARIEQCVLTAVNDALPRRTLNACNKIPVAQLFNSRSKNACYRPFFPSLPAAEIKPSYKSQKGSFGMGDAVRDSLSEQQRLYNKKNAIKYGQLILPQTEIERLIPAANLTDYDRSRVLKAKSDDLYDTMFMALYFGSSHLHHYAKIIRANSPETICVFESPPQRPLNCWEELFEFCMAIGTPKENVEKLLATLVAYDNETEKK